MQHEWEYSKENIQVIKEGRNVQDLEKQLINKEPKKVELAKNQTYQKKIEQNPTSLEIWVEYIQFMRQYYASNQEKVMKVIYKCTQTLKDIEKYKNDVRYIKLWILYADSVPDAELVFAFMEQNRIGNKTSIFYIGYAWVLEKKKKFKLANQMYERGVTIRAEPQSSIVQRQKEFERRMRRVILDAQPVSEDADARKSLGRISSHASVGSFRPNEPAMQGLKGEASSNNHHESPFEVFNDQGQDSSVKSSGNWKHLPTTKVLTKENTARSGAWKDGSCLPIDCNQVSGTLEVFEDEQEVPVAKSKQKAPSFRNPEPPLAGGKPLRKSAAVVVHKDSVYLKEDALSFEEHRAKLYIASKIKPAEEDVTINTRLALNDVNQLFFSSPPSKPMSSRVDATPTLERQLEFNIFEDSCLPSTIKKHPHTDATINCSAVDLPLGTRDVAYNRVTNKDVMDQAFQQRSCTDEEDFDSNDDLYTRVIDPFSSDNRPHALCAIFYYVMQMPTTTIADMYPKIYFHPGKGPFHSRLVSKTPFQLACDRFKMTKVLGQGSYATVYDVELLNSAYSLPAKHHVALKYSKDATQLTMEFYMQHIIKRRTHHEHFKTYALHVYQGDHTAYYLLDKGHHGTLYDVVNEYKQYGKVLPEAIVVFYTIQMIQEVQSLHAVQILHGDIKPDNWLLFTRKVVHLIDYGRSIDLSWYPEDIEFLNDAPSQAKGYECLEMRNHHPYKYQIDLFGLTASIHTLLFGEEISLHHNKDGTYQLRSSFKRYWDKSLWTTFFSSMLNDRIDQQSSNYLSIILPPFLTYANQPSYQKTLKDYFP